MEWEEEIAHGVVKTCGLIEALHTVKNRYKEQKRRSWEPQKRRQGPEHKDVGDKQSLHLNILK